MSLTTSCDGSYMLSDILFYLEEDYINSPYLNLILFFATYAVKTTTVWRHERPKLHSHFNLYCETQHHKSQIKLHKGALLLSVY